MPGMCASGRGLAGACPHHTHTHLLALSTCARAPMPLPRWACVISQTASATTSATATGARGRAAGWEGVTQQCWQRLTPLPPLLHCPRRASCGSCKSFNSDHYCTFSVVYGGWAGGWEGYKGTWVQTPGGCSPLGLPRQPCTWRCMPVVRRLLMHRTPALSHTNTCRHAPTTHMLTRTPGANANAGDNSGAEGRAVRDSVRFSRGGRPFSLVFGCGETSCDGTGCRQPAAGCWRSAGRGLQAAAGCRRRPPAQAPAAWPARSLPYPSPPKKSLRLPARTVHGASTGVRQRRAVQAGAGAALLRRRPPSTRPSTAPPGPSPVPPPLPQAASQPRPTAASPATLPLSPSLQHHQKMTKTPPKRNPTARRMGTHPLPP